MAIPAWSAGLAALGLVQAQAPAVAPSPPPSGPGLGQDAFTSSSRLEPVGGHGHDEAQPDGQVGTVGTDLVLGPAPALPVAGAAAPAPAANPFAGMPAPATPAFSRTGVPRPTTLWMPANTQQIRPAGMAIDTIVLHHTNSGGTAQQVAGFFAKPDTKVSAHYIVGRDGTIVHCVPDQGMARHAGVSEFQGREDVNRYSLGIEIDNLGDGVDPYTDAQYQALAKLMAYLQSEHNIPWAQVTGHKDIARPVGRKDDPSANFSYARLRAETEALLAPASP